MVVAVVEVFAIRGEHSVSCHGAHTFRFSDDGRIAEVWGFVDDQTGLDRLLSGGA